MASRDAAGVPSVKGEDIVKQATEHRSFQTPDETRAFPNGRAELVNIGDAQVGRLVFEPVIERHASEHRGGPSKLDRAPAPTMKRCN